MSQTLNISAGPHVRDRWTTPFIMYTVLIALLPAAAIGVIVNIVKYNSFNALWVILASVGSAVLTELLFCLVTKRPISIKDGSAAVTGMLLALSLSPSTPFWLPIIGSAFAILVVKCCFGGLGKNFINPALAARCFLLISFGNAMTQFPLVDGISSATPVAELAAGRAVDITAMFYGTANGVIGGSVLALLVGGLILWGLDIIHGEICFSVVVGFTLFMGLFGGQGFDPKFLLAHLCGGGVIMGAFFMATDYTTSPVSRLGQLVYGCLIGVLGALFRCFGHSADSFSYSIIIANLATPLIDTFIVPKPYAYRKSAIRKANGEKKPPIWQRIPKPVIALTLITLLAGVALSGVFKMTESTIDAQKLAAKQASYKVVCPDADHFVTDDDAEAALAALNGGVYGTKFGRTYINEAGIILMTRFGQGRPAAAKEQETGSLLPTVFVCLSACVLFGVAFAAVNRGGLSLWDVFWSRLLSRFSQAQTAWSRLAEQFRNGGYQLASRAVELWYQLKYAAIEVRSLL